MGSFCVASVSSSACMKKCPKHGNHQWCIVRTGDNWCKKQLVQNLASTSLEQHTLKFRKVDVTDYMRHKMFMKDIN